MTRKTVLITIVLFLSNADGQELGLLSSQAWTDNEELGNPLSIGVYGSLNLPSSFVLEISFDYFSNDRTYNGVTSDNGVLPQNLVSEPIQSSSQSRMWKVTLCYEPLRFDWISVGIGPSVSTSFFSGDRRGTLTGRRAGGGGGQKFGFGYSFAIRIVPMGSLPIAISIAASKVLLGASAFVTETDNPFALPIRFTVLRLNVGYSFKQ